MAKSSAVIILLVECRLMEIGTSSDFIPFPLSFTSIKFFPPLLIVTDISVAEASIAFSNNSLITDAGLSITSPAAILLITSGSRI